MEEIKIKLEIEAGKVYAITCPKCGKEYETSFRNNYEKVIQKENVHIVIRYSAFTRLLKRN